MTTAARPAAPRAVPALGERLLRTVLTAVAALMILWGAYHVGYTWVRGESDPKRVEAIRAEAELALQRAGEHRAYGEMLREMSATLASTGYLVMETGVGVLAVLLGVGGLRWMWAGAHAADVYMEVYRLRAAVAALGEREGFRYVTGARTINTEGLRSAGPVVDAVSHDAAGKRGDGRADVSPAAPNPGAVGLPVHLGTLADEHRRRRVGA